MKKNNWLFIGALTFLTLVPVSSSAAYSNLFGSTTESSYSIQSTKYEYRYKKENGHIYKRLYNIDKCKWVGKWILVK